MAKPNFYDVLGVSKTATQDQIRKAYKKIARENHPDAKPNDKAAADRFKQANEAYEVLGDEEKRKKYDQFGDAYEYVQGAGGGGGGAGPFPGGFDPSSVFGGGGDIDLGDIFGGAFGGRSRSRAPRARKGEDLQTSITVPFQMAADGGSYDVSLQKESGVERLAVKVPPGVNTGDVIRLSGQGHAGIQGGPSGDLLITVHVAPHPVFKRDGDNLTVDLPISVTEAVLGAKVDVPTLSEGTVVMTIPAGTSSGAKLRLKGKGILNRKSGERGDQYVQIRIVVPTSLSGRARELFQELSNELPPIPR
ncbi:DnaJ C-terminal domain-containing protein [Planctomyces sp. SH-PL14]|uniref:DnaJ C-terminal domain-containing protein n=1 Tax=Planctomyces sp. SH-PL14 TaxID=1632864 RepID=UPI00078CE14F|nr:DnaJ C-terminal domain-containing protein [Planctomyces sp. SH-PL14]AMV22104.1 Chaperone protein DnaJ [Planctomyces sp. SH-PL14]